MEYFRARQGQYLINVVVLDNYHKPLHIAFLEPGTGKIIAITKHAQAIPDTVLELIDEFEDWRAEKSRPQNPKVPGKDEETQAKMEPFCEEYKAALERRISKKTALSTCWKNYHQQEVRSGREWQDVDGDYDVFRKRLERYWDKWEFNKEKLSKKSLDI